MPVRTRIELFGNHSVAISPTVIVSRTYLLIKHTVYSFCHLDIRLSSQAWLVVWMSPEEFRKSNDKRRCSRRGCTSRERCNRAVSVICLVGEQMWLHVYERTYEAIFMLTNYPLASKLLKGCSKLIEYIQFGSQPFNR